MSAPSTAKRTKAKNAKNGSPQKHQGRSFHDYVAIAAATAVNDDINKQITYAERRINANLKYTLEAFMLMASVTKQILIEKLGETEASFNNRLLNEEDRIEGYFATDTLGATKGNFVRLEVLGGSEEEQKAGPQLIKIKDLAANPPELHAEFEAALIGMKTGDKKDVTITLNGVDTSYKVTMTRVSIKQAASEGDKSEEENSKGSA